MWSLFEEIHLNVPQSENDGNSNNVLLTLLMCQKLVLGGETSANFLLYLRQEMTGKLEIKTTGDAL